MMVYHPVLEQEASQFVATSSPKINVIDTKKIVYVVYHNKHLKQMNETIEETISIDMVIAVIRIKMTVLCRNRQNIKKCCERLLHALRLQLNYPSKKKEERLEMYE
jgi:uncharacterized protein with PIN domain